MGTGSGHPRVNTRCVSALKKLANFCNHTHIAKSMVVFAVIMLLNGGLCGQKMNQPQTWPTKTVPDSSQASSSILLENVRDHRNDNVDEFPRNKRQILQPSPERRKKPEEMDTELTDIHIDFIADMAILRGWSAVFIILPGNGGQLCEYLATNLARSRASLTSECGDEERMASITLVVSMPVFSFYFLRPRNMTSSSSPLHRTLLTPTRPAFVLGGNLSDRDALLRQVQLVGMNGCVKWTLIWGDGPNMKTLMVEDIYGFPGVGVAPLTQVIGNWSGDGGLKIDQELALGPSDFKGRTLRITTVAVFSCIFRLLLILDHSIP